MNPIIDKKAAITEAMPAPLLPGGLSHIMHASQAGNKVLVPSSLVLAGLRLVGCVQGQRLYDARLHCLFPTGFARKACRYDGPRGRSDGQSVG